MNIVLSLTLVAFVTSALCYLNIQTKSHHIAWARETGAVGRQKLHIDVVPEVGVFQQFSDGLGYGVSGGALRPEILAIYAGLLPYFAAGLVEDITKKASPTQRYVATVV